MRRVLVFLIILSSTYFYAQESTVNFSIKNFGVNVNGYFEDVSISVIFNSENEIEDVSAYIMVSSITTGMESRDKHILKEDFFYVEKFDRIVLETIELKKDSLTRYLLTGNIIIRDKSQRLIIPIEVENNEEVILVKSNFEINRKDFGVGGSSLVLGKKVKISVNHKVHL